MNKTHDTKRSPNWEPYLKPTSGTHDSGFGCFEVGYLQLDRANKKAMKKVVLGNGVDHISNWFFSSGLGAVDLEMDLLLDGNIRVYCYPGKKLFWNIPGISDACIVTDVDCDITRTYETLDRLWEKQEESWKNTHQA